MARFGTLEFVSTAETPGGKPRVVGHSGHISPGFKNQIEATLNGWASLTKTGFTASALSSFPLKGDSEYGPENFFAVTVTWRDEDIQHKSFIVPDSEFAKYGFNPYRFIGSLDPELLGVTALNMPGGKNSKTPRAEIQSLVIDGLQQLLGCGELHLPLAAPDADCDLILAFMIAAIPVRTRASLHFTSFCPIDPWGWNLAAVRQPGGSLVDWKRRVMDLVGNDLSPQVTSYLSAVSGYLAAGDERGLAELARKDTLQLTLNATADGGRISAVVPKSLPRKSPGAPTISRPPKATRQALQETGPIEVAKPRLKRHRVVLERRKLRKITLADPYRNRRIPAGVVAVFVVMFVAFFGWKFGVLSEDSLQSLGNRFRPGRGDQSELQARTQLLAVVDVARSYDDILTEYRSGSAGGQPQEQAARVAALSALKSRAAIPLIQKVGTYLDVVDMGIQQGWQPDREVRRLHALTQEGQDLRWDLTRLELAWISLANGILWQDLSGLNDHEVAARFDSLARRQRELPTRAEAALDIQGLPEHLTSAMDQTGAMATLIDLFEASAWSTQWQQQLLAAAKRVPPAASSATRAYCNTAFALGRLKDAEHSQAALQVPYGQGWGMGTWPVSEVRSQLPMLRRMADMFSQSQIPPVVAGTVEIYSLLADEASAAAKAAGDPGFWLRLHANHAVTFDPVVFEDVLARVRFEALRTYLDRGDPSETWPEHLTTQAATPGITEFYRMLAHVRSPEIWQAYSEETPDAFFARWAAYLAATYRNSSRARLVAFTRAWEDLIGTSGAVKEAGEQGRDWTADWLDLHTSALDFLDRYVLAFSDYPVCQAQVAVVSNLLEAMSQPVTVRLTGASLHLNGVTEVVPLVLELKVRPTSNSTHGKGPLLTSAVLAGPGENHVDLAWTIELLPQQWVEIRIRDQENGHVLFDAVCPSLLERVGPAGLMRELKTDAGTVSFQVDQGLWREMDIPDLTGVF